MSSTFLTVLFHTSHTFYAHSAGTGIGNGGVSCCLMLRHGPSRGCAPPNEEVSGDSARGWPRFGRGAAGCDLDTQSGRRGKGVGRPSGLWRSHCVKTAKVT